MISELTRIVPSMQIATIEHEFHRKMDEDFSNYNFLKSQNYLKFNLIVSLNQGHLPIG